MYEMIDRSNVCIDRLNACIDRSNACVLDMIGMTVIFLFQIAQK